MLRIFLSFVFVPLFVSLFFGSLFLLVAPMAWAACLVLAVPLFVLFARNGWLRNWQVVLAGILCGLLTGGVLTLGKGLYSTIQGPANLAMFTCVGGCIAYGFWWVGLYRNPRFGMQMTSSLFSSLYPLPVLACLGLLNFWYSASFSDAVALGEQQLVGGRNVARIQLPDGTQASAELDDGLRSPLPGEKLTVESRRTLIAIGRRYWIIWISARPGQEPTS